VETTEPSLSETASSADRSTARLLNATPVVLSFPHRTPSPAAPA